MKILKRMIIVVCILLLVFLIMLGIIGNYLYNYAIAANTSKAEVFQKNSETECLQYFAYQMKQVKRKISF